MRDEAEWKTFLAKVRELRLSASDYAVFGSGPMLAHGLIEKADDIDILARDEAWKAAKSLGKVRMGTHDPFVRLGGGIEIFNGWMRMDADEIIDNAAFIEGVPFARLEDVLVFKRSLGREKDLEHIRLIEGRTRL